MAASQPGVFNLQCLTDTGAPASGYRLYTYTQGTTTLKTAYTDPAGTVPQTYVSDGAGGSYIQLNARGELPSPLFLTSGAYDIALKTPAGATVWTRYAVGANDASVTLAADLLSSNSAKGDALVAHTDTGTGAATTTVRQRLLQWINVVADYGADPTGVADSTTAIQKALDAGRGRVVFFPAGTYKVSTITVTQPNTQMVGAAASQYSLADCTILMGSSASADVLLVADGVTGGSIKGFLIKKSVTATDGAGLRVGHGVTMDLDTIRVENNYDGFRLGGTNFARAVNCHATQNYRHGFFAYNAPSPAAYAPLQWVMESCLAAANGGTGFVFYAQQDDTSGNITGVRMNKCGTYANTGGGYVFSSLTNIHHNDITCVDTYSSLDGNHGWRFDNPGTSIILVGCFAEGAGLGNTGRGQLTAPSSVGAGFLVQSGGVSYAYLTLVGFVSRQNSYQGIAVASNAVFARMTLTGCQCIDNGQTGNRSGIDLQNTTAIYTLSACQSSNHQTSNQLYGLNAGNAANVYVSACDFSGNINGPWTAAAGVMRASATKGIGEQPTSNDRGDASVTVAVGTDYPVQVFATPLTANRTVTLSTTGAVAGDRFRCVRQTTATGASTLTFAGKALAVGQWAEAHYSGASWTLTAFGSL